MSSEMFTGKKEFGSFSSRGLDKKTLEKFGVYVKRDPETRKPTDLCFPYFDENGNEISTKIRKIDTPEGGKQQWSWVNPPKHKQFFGQHVYPAGSHKTITLCEGELDCLSVAQMFSGNQAIVSIPDGANSVRKVIKDNYDYLKSFDIIKLCFDADEPGQKAVQEAASLLRPWIKRKALKVVAMNPLFKDANGYLMAGAEKEFFSVWWNAADYTPNNTLSSESFLDIMLTKEEEVDSVPYLWDSLQAMTGGIRGGELVALLALPKIGKSASFKNFIYGFMEQSPKPVGVLMIEEKPDVFIKDLFSLFTGKPYRKKEYEERVSDKEILEKVHRERFSSGSIKYFNQFGSVSPDQIIQQITEWHDLFGIKNFFFDHLTMCISGLEMDRGFDERRIIDNFVTKLKQLTVDLNINIHVISHVNDDGQPRSSRALLQLSDLVIKLERDKLNECPIERNITHLIVTENRYTGETGPACKLFFDKDTTRMVEVTDEEIEDLKQQVAAEKFQDKNRQEFEKFKQMDERGF